MVMHSASFVVRPSSVVEPDVIAREGLVCLLPCGIVILPCCGRAG
jgi:hypothetical protein